MTDDRLRAFPLASAGTEDDSAARVDLREVTGFIGRIIRRRLNRRSSLLAVSRRLLRGTKAIRVERTILPIMLRNGSLCPTCPCRGDLERCPLSIRTVSILILKCLADTGHHHIRIQAKAAYGRATHCLMHIQFLTGFIRDGFRGKRAATDLRACAGIDRIDSQADSRSRTSGRISAQDETSRHGIVRRDRRSPIRCDRAAGQGRLDYGIEIIHRYIEPGSRLGNGHTYDSCRDIRLIAGCYIDCPGFRTPCSLIDRKRTVRQLSCRATVIIDHTDSSTGCGTGQRSGD